MIAPARARTVGGALLGVFAAFALSASVALAAPGNNGTVKVHDSPGEPSPEIKNQPHVDCPFHFHFFFADAFQSGDWWVVSWSPTGDGSVVLTGSYTTDSNGEYVTPDQQLDAGHYKLYWEGDTVPGGNTPIKHKVFWVDTSCEQAVEESPPESPPEGGPAAGGPTPFNGSTIASAPAPSNGPVSGTELAVLLGGGSALALVVLRPVRGSIRRRK
jgi:hypothetical protein